MPQEVVSGPLDRLDQYRYVVIKGVRPVPASTEVEVLLQLCVRSFDDRDRRLIRKSDPPVRLRLAIGLGLLLAWLVAPYIGALLQIDLRAPSMFAGVAAVFLATGLVAALIPALRAAATDPADVLRGE